MKVKVQKSSMEQRCFFEEYREAMVSDMGMETKTDTVD
jgi:hypothetical protein